MITLIAPLMKNMDQGGSKFVAFSKGSSEQGPTQDLSEPGKSKESIRLDRCITLNSTQVSFLIFLEKNMQNQSPF